MLSKFGEVCAFEMSADACALARKRAPLADVRVGLFPDAVPFQDRKFDLVCLFDVLEHVHDDVGALKALHQLLTPAGRLLVTVPACPSLWSQHDVDLHHHRRYVQSALIDTIKSSGLQVVWISYFNTLLFPLALLNRWHARLFRCKPAGDTLPRPWANRLLRRIFAAERHVVYPGQLPIGVSLVAVTRR